MEALTIIYLLVFLVFALIGSAILQIRMAGIKIKDFWGFVQANQMLDKLYKFSKRYKAHDENNECKVGDKVRIMETKPLSKDKHWRVVEIIEKAK